MDNEQLLKKVMNAKVDGRSATGRPRFGWMDGVKGALNDMRMDMRETTDPHTVPNVLDASSSKSKNKCIISCQ